MDTRDVALASFLLVILMIGIISEKQAVPSAAHIIAFALVGCAWFVRQMLKRPE